MRQARLVALAVPVLLLLLISGAAFAAVPHEIQLTATVTPTLIASPTPVPELTYAVRPGDTLYRIAVRFRTTVRVLAEANGITNPALIFVGQQLRIPGIPAATPTPQTAPTSTAAPTTTPIPIATTTYTVQRGDTLFKIAVRFNTTIAQLVSLNELANPNIIYVGQVLKVPTQNAGVAAPTATMPATPLPSATPAVAATATPGQGGGTTTGFGFDYGIEAFLVDQEIAPLAGDISDIGMRWVKQTINWRDFEPVKGDIDFATLDEIVEGLNSAGIRILLTITAAPAWARSSNVENGPPDRFSDYADFVSALAGRYAGKVQAYEVWNEPNLRREWNSAAHPIGAASYYGLLQAAYAAIKAADPSALVISAGLAPTGFNDGVNAIDDRLYLRNLYSLGLGEVSDAIGAHPLGWANPPDAVCCVAPVGVETHFENPSFYFLNTLNDYRQIMVEANDGSTPIWVTKFGWGTSEDTDPPSANNVFLTYTSLGEQAVYVPQGFERGAELGFIGPMFVDNLNGCAINNTEACAYSFIGPDGQPRPVYQAVSDLINPRLQVDTVQPGPTVEPTLAEATPESSTTLPTASTGG
jgi:LysM repeat protein